MKRLRRDDVTMNVTITGVVIRGLTDGCLSFSLPDCRKRAYRRYIVRSLHPKLRATPTTHETASRSPNAIFLLFKDSLDGDPCLLLLNFFWIIATRTILFQYRTAYENITLPVNRSTCTSRISNWLIRSNRGIIYHTIDRYM